MGLDATLKAHGVTDADLQALLGVSSEAVRLWRKDARRMSVKHARMVNEQWGIPLHALRPDVYEPPEPCRGAA